MTKTQKVIVLIYAAAFLYMGIRISYGWPNINKRTMEYASRRGGI